MRVLAKILIMSAAVASASLAHAEDSRTWVQDLDLIDLQVDQSVVNNAFAYPGMGGANGFDDPDCLALVTSGNAPDGAQEALAAELQVYDGASVLFGQGFDLNLLAPELQTGGRLVYRLTDLGAYVTGLRVATRGDVTLQQAVRNAFGPDYAGAVALQVVRGCRTL